jgi:hypothetical protein
LDLAAAVKDGRARARLANELRERRAELSVMKLSEAASLLAEIDKTLAMPSIGDGQELVKRADFLIEEEFKAMAAEERRRAVLEGLASLGYEVSEGMATAWVQNGQIVLRKAANPGYGVELLGGSKSDLLQVRAVGIGSSAEARDASRDRDMETIWCGEFDRLKALVAKAGGNVSIESHGPLVNSLSRSCRNRLQAMISADRTDHYPSRNRRVLARCVAQNQQDSSVVIKCRAVLHGLSLPR